MKLIKIDKQTHIAIPFDELEHQIGDLETIVENFQSMIETARVENQTKEEMITQVAKDEEQKSFRNYMGDLEWELKNIVPSVHSWITDSKLRYGRFNTLIKRLRKAGYDILIFRDRKKDGISVKICNRRGIDDKIRGVFRMLADQTLPLIEPEDMPSRAYYYGTERYLFHIKPKPGAKYEEAWKVLVARKAAERKAKRTAARRNSKRVAKKRDRKK